MAMAPREQRGPKKAVASRRDELQLPRGSCTWGSGSEVICQCSVDRLAFRWRCVGPRPEDVAVAQTIVLSLKHAMRASAPCSGESLRKAVQKAIAQVSTELFDEYPLPLEWACHTSLKGPTKSERLQTDWFPNFEPALKFRRLVDEVDTRRKPRLAKEHLLKLKSELKGTCFQPLSREEEQAFQSALLRKARNHPVRWRLMSKSPFQARELHPSGRGLGMPCAGTPRYEAPLALQDLATQVKHNVLSCLVTPLVDRLERLASLRAEGAINGTAHRAAVNAEIFASSPGPIAHMPGWVTDFLRKKGVPKKDWITVYQAALHHSAVRPGMEEAVGEVARRSAHQMAFLSPQMIAPT